VSTLSAVLIIAAVLAFSGTAAYYQIRRAQGLCGDESAIEAGRISGSFAPAARPASEVRPGTDLAAQDALELLYSIPAHDPESTAGRARLQQAIDDDTNQGDQ
jgi:hypothetical protein